MKLDRRLDILLVVVAVVTVGTLILAAVAVPAIFTSRDNSAQVARGNEIGSCRSVSRADTVDSAILDSLDTILAGLDASLSRDPVALDEARADVPAQREANKAAIAEYRRVARQAVTATRTFLAECKKASG